MAAVPLFSGLRQRHLRKILKASTVDEYDPGTLIVREGAHGQTLFVILEGSATVTRGAKTLARLSPGDFFGELAVIDDRPRTATVTAETPVRCLVLYRDELRDVLENEASAAWAVLVKMASRFRGD